MDNNIYNESYVYKYTNKISGRIYYGARWAYSRSVDKSAYDDFDTCYRSSSLSSEFWNDMNEGLLEGEIIFIFTKNDLPVEVIYNNELLVINDVKTLALYYEDLLIEECWRTLGKKFSYNKVRNFSPNCDFYNVDNRTDYLNSDEWKKIAADSMRKRQKKAQTPEAREKANETNKNNHGGILAFHSPENREKQRESDRINHGGVRAWDLPDSIKKRNATFMQNYDPTSWLNSKEAMDKKNNTNLARYGCINHTNLLNTEDAQRKSHEYYLYITSNDTLSFMTRNSASHWYPDWVKLCKKSETDDYIKNLVESKSVIDRDIIIKYINNLLSDQLQYN